MIDLDLESTGTNTDSEKWLRSSKDSGVKISSESGSKSRGWNSSPHSFSNNRMWLNIGDSSSRMTGVGTKTDSKMLLKMDNKIGVNIDLEILDHKFEDQSHIPYWVQFHKNENLPICQ